MSEPGAERLRRTLRFVDVYALAVGGVIGTGIFFLPGKAAERMGPAALVAYLIAAALCGLLVMCYAEAASRFRTTGGAMAYAQRAFGGLVAFEVGWATWVSRVVSWGGLANIFVVYLAKLWPDAASFHVPLVAALFAVLTALNLRGVGPGGRANTVLTAAKLLPLLLFVGVGAFHIDSAAFEPFAPQGYGSLGATTVLMMYAFVGFEGMVIPAAEMRNPQRTVPPALILGMATIALLYVAIWAVCTGTLATFAGAESPVGEAATQFMGPGGSSFVLIGIVVSVIGINAFMALITPRALYALSHAGLAPTWLGRVSDRQVPAVAIWITSLVAFTLALTSNFWDLAVVSVVARIAQYVPTCLAVLRLRAMPDVEPASFRAPFGPFLPILAVAVCLWLLVETESRKLLWGTIAVGAGVFVYVPWARLRAGRESSGPGHSR